MSNTQKRNAVDGPASIQATGPTKIAHYKLQHLEAENFRDLLLACTDGLRKVVQTTEGLADGTTEELNLAKEVEGNLNLKWNGGSKFVPKVKSPKGTKNTILSVDAVYCPSVDHFSVDPEGFMENLFSNAAIFHFLTTLAHMDPFSEQFAEMVALSGDVLSRSLDLLANLKKLKYFLNLSVAHVLQLLSQLSVHTVLCHQAPGKPTVNNKRETPHDNEGPEKKSPKEATENSWIFAFTWYVTKLVNSNEASVKHLLKTQVKNWVLSKLQYGDWDKLSAYRALELDLEKVDPHATFPTSIYRRCNGLTLASSDAQTIEAVMGTVVTTTIKITRSVLDPDSNHLLADVYLPLGRVVAIIDNKVDDLGYSQQVRAYFSHFNIDATILVFGGNEIDKDMSTVEKILVALKKNNVIRNQPVLIVGGGVLSDTAGLACALYHRNTPYVMLSTSIVSGIDAGPSPRTCCDGFGYKNLYGVYHPPVLTLTDRMFWKTLKTGWVRHGIAEIVKMACVKDLRAFELLEKCGNLLVQTKFGTDMDSLTDREAELLRRGFHGEEDFQMVCDEIVGRAMEGYTRSEYGNLWETHQARPHAYGHTWSPGYELPAGMLHGHAVATCMGYGAYMSRYHWECQDFVEADGQKKARSWMTDEQLMRILNLINELELALYHPIMDNVEVIWSAQLKMTEKRGGNLAAPVPKGEIGQCGYINLVDKTCLRNSLGAYKDFVTGTLDDKMCVPRFKRHGYGIEVHCHDVGLQDPSTVIKPDDLQVPINTCKLHNEAKSPCPFKRKHESFCASKRVRSHARTLDDQGSVVPGFNFSATHLGQQQDPPSHSGDTSELKGSSSSVNISRRTMSVEKTSSGDSWTGVNPFQPSSYQEWIKVMQTKRHQNTRESIAAQYDLEGLKMESVPPVFPHFHLFADESVEHYALQQTTPCSANIHVAAQLTDKAEMFLPCMVGALESQFLKMTATMGRCKRILDVGTFTGMSAIAFAESGPDVKVVTLEFDKKTANIAQSIFDAIDPNVGSRIEMKVGDARDIMLALSKNNEKYDLIFLDADKENYETYYHLAIDGGLLMPGGLILADNSACALLYDAADERRDALHKFNKCVAQDERVEQVLLTIREGVTMIRRKNDPPLHSGVVEQAPVESFMDLATVETDDETGKTMPEESQPSQQVVYYGRVAAVGHLLLLTMVLPIFSFLFFLLKIVQRSVQFVVRKGTNINHTKNRRLKKGITRAVTSQSGSMRDKDTQIPPTILIVGAHFGKTLTIMRCIKAVLPDKKSRIILTDSPKYAMNGARFSRYCDAFEVVHSDPIKNARGYAKELVKIAQKHKVTGFLPISQPAASQADAEACEAITVALGKGTKVFDRPYHVSAALCDTLDDKFKFCQMCEKLGGMVTAPRTVFLNSEHRVRELNEELVARKERLAHAGRTLPSHEHMIIKNLRYDCLHRLDLFTLPATREDLDNYLAKLRNDGNTICEEGPWVAQTKLIGKEYSAACVIRDGQVRLLTVSPSSASQLCFKHIKHTVIEKWVYSFVERCNGQNQGMRDCQLCFDFIDVKDGERGQSLVFPIECNTRVHSQLSVFSTTELGRVLLGSALMGTDVSTESMAEYEATTTSDSSTMHFGDEMFKTVFRIKNYLGAGSSQPGMSVSFLASYIRSLSVFLGNDADLSVEDPLPFFAKLHLQLPSLLMSNICRGNPWKKVDFCIGKVIELHGE